MSQSIVGAAPPPTEPPAAAVAEGTAARKIEGRSPWRLGMERLVRDRAAMISLGVIILIVLLAIFAPVIAALTGHGPNEQFQTTGLTAIGQPKPPNSDVPARDRQPGPRRPGPDRLRGPDFADRRGRGHRPDRRHRCGRRPDIRLLRRPDRLGDRPVHRLAAGHPVPAVRHLPGGGRSGPSLTVVIIVIGFFGWASVGRIVRGQVLSIKEKEYVEAARALGASPWRIMFFDILPNVMAPIIVYATLLIPLTIVIEASLSFLGVGVPPPTADWGQMISDAQGVYQYGAWWFLVFPSLALLVTTLAFNILGDGVRDAFDPRGDQLFV